ncbi:MAG TPA: ClpXP protease specificity-enhancing factor SspB [Polyangiaceae bacterium]
MSTLPEPPPKKEVMLALLERSSVFIHLDPRKDEVRVPPWFKKQPQLVLQVGLNMAVRIPDLDVGDDAVSCTLSFNRSPVFCYMPWSSVFALVADDGKGMIWPNDIPKEVAAQQAQQAEKDQTRAQIRPVPAPVASIEAAPKAAKATKGKEDPVKPAARKRSPARLRAEKPVVLAEEKSPAPAAAAAPKAPPSAAESQGRGAPASRPGRDGKRELPSYLRVVK